MVVLILTVLIGLFLAYFATQNTDIITMRLFDYPVLDIPLYMIVIGSLLVGVCIAWIISFVGSVSSSFKIRGKDSALKDAKRTIAELTKRVHQLELQNVELKTKTGEEDEDETSL